ncbi:MAG: hypothetical protein ABI603_04305 [Acidobacteriota bacterium]
MRAPRLLDGNDYDVMLRNLWRLLAWGATLAEARPLVLAQAGASVFPDPPASRRARPTFDAIDVRTAAVH